MDYKLEVLWTINLVSWSKNSKSYGVLTHSTKPFICKSKEWKWVTTMWTNSNIVFGHNWCFSIGWGFAFSCTFSWTQDPSLMLLHFLDKFSSKVGLKFKLIMAGLSVIPTLSFSVPRASCSIKMRTRLFLFTITYSFVS